MAREHPITTFHHGTERLLRREGNREELLQHFRNILTKKKTQGRGAKSRDFITTLKDYYIDKNPGELDTPESPDGWAIQYININYARTILEAFDDDASGFVTISEVNNFIRSRPQNWRCVISSRACSVSEVIHLPAFRIG